MFFLIGPRIVRGALTWRLFVDTGVLIEVADVIGFVTSLSPRRQRDIPQREMSPKETAKEEINREERPAETTAQAVWHEDAAIPTEPTHRADMAKATVAFLETQLDANAIDPTPTVQLIRVGVVGVELLLADPCDPSPAGFSALGDGLVWRLDARADLERFLAKGVLEHLVDLTALGDDDESTYFLVPEISDPPFCDEFPRMPDNASIPLLSSPMMLIATDTGVVLEPFGLHFKPSVTENTPEDQAKADVKTQPLVEPVGQPHGCIGTDNEMGGAVNEEVNTDGLKPEEIGPEEVEPEDIHAEEVEVADEVVETIELTETDQLIVVDNENACIDETPESHDHQGELVPPGIVDVRILRDDPDLVGELFCDAPPAAVDLVAYLVLHGHRSTMTRLRDSIGITKTQSSRSGKTVWAAASAARRAFGQELLPGASGNRFYQLDKAVTCDWLRFRALVGIAKEPGANRERCQAALTQALELVDGIPATASRRFCWLDEEGILSEISRGVAVASAMLALLELDGGSQATVRWALDKGLMFSPGDTQLLALETEFGQRQIPVAP